ncbi:ribonuclease R [candidate division KSB1 bacterium]|nr:ribonuclease R [candidate division KSB1 bacterium]
MKEKIVKFLKLHPDRTFRKRDLFRELKLNPGQYADFRDALAGLEGEGRVLRFRGGRYGLSQRVNLVTGKVHLKTQGYGFLIRDDGGEDVFIPRRNLGGAFPEDRVQVALFARRQGQAPEGKVVQVMERTRMEFVGIYRKEGNFGLFFPDNIKCPDIFIPEGKSAGAETGQRVVVKVVDWGSSHRPLQGEVTEVLGEADDPALDFQVVIRHFAIPTTFPPDVLQEVDMMGDGLVEDPGAAGRLDLTDKVIFTIDPEDARDFDDAVSIERLGNGEIELGAHIADVGHYVLAGNVVDQEALKRGTSVYLVDGVVPMLPERLSNELCSLKPNEKRLTYSVIMKLNTEGDLLDYAIRKSVIRSRRRFTYEEVQKIIDAVKRGEGPSQGDPDREFYEAIRRMYQLSQTLLKKRVYRGSMDFDLPEVKITLDGNGRPTEIRHRERLESHRLIEEFMLLANRTVTEYIARKRRNERLPFVYRVHERPSDKKLEQFSAFVRAMGYTFNHKDPVTPMDFQQFLRKIKRTEEKVVIEEVALRSMMKAIYSPKNSGHFGLAFKHYTHFTSPIRRYPDLMVHRLLAQYENPVQPERKRAIGQSLKPICNHSTEMEIRAVEAERMSIKLKQIEYLKDHIGEVYKGIISGVVAFGIFVEITELLVEGLVHITDLKDDYYVFDEKRLTLVGRTFGNRYRLGDHVKVRVVRVDKNTRTVDFALSE